MEEAVGNIEKQMQKADQKLDDLAEQVTHVEKGIAGYVPQVKVRNLAQLTTRIKGDYQNLRQDILEVQDLQKQLSSSLSAQAQLLQMKYHYLKQKLSVPPNARVVPTIIVTDASPGRAFHESK